MIAWMRLTLRQAKPRGIFTSHTASCRARPTLSSAHANAQACTGSVRVKPSVPHPIALSVKLGLLHGSALALSPSADAPSGWLLVGAVVGLPTALWAYKCLMMVLFQRKIIYMNYVPPSARTEKLGEIVKLAAGIFCEEIRIDGEKDVTLYGILVRKSSVEPESVKTVLVYLQGNAGNPLGRIPVFEHLLLGPTFFSSSSGLDETAILAVAPRSYWKSSSRTPTEQGLISDYTHAIAYAAHRFPSASIILYGHSLGGAAAVCLSAQVKRKDFPNVKGMILENPFGSIAGTVKALYPQRWLPYHYLGRFAFDKWDAVAAMQDAPPDSLLHELSRSMLVMLSKNDEIVPNAMGRTLFDAASERLGEAVPNTGGFNDLKKLVIIDRALHEDAWQRRLWRTTIGDYVTKMQALSSNAGTPLMRTGRHK